MIYRVRHYTEYNYEESVSICYNRLCLTPVSTDGQTCISSELNIVPSPHELTFRDDFFGNRLAFFGISKSHKRLRINSNSMVRVEVRDYTAATESIIRWDKIPQLIKSESNSHDIVQYFLPSHYIPYSQPVKDFCADCFVEGETLWSVCMKLMVKIHGSFEFKPGFTTVNTPVETVIKIRKGVCQDLAHLMIACLRNMGIPARYVSGYIETVPPPGKEKLVGADASHAWVSVYFPSIGWIEFDPTNNQLPTDRHITVAIGRDYQDVAPIKGIVYSSGNQKLVVRVDVERLED
jgi:transglutaminase-like putative cysteine protease